ncbi:unnamed protein product [Cyprideis torosa]|uniref:Uncharacterized protein n=1 Tax=Cyprideis torosa TaxID=163714 RepID=A0A7R8ZSY2_9CRUS|nr:unnamed protein product [Cyprideis torosa]CAG0896664.1 unnamed protein product [Cyprideis torosa]
MTQPDTTVDGFETLIGEDLVEDPDSKELVKQSEGAPRSENRLEVARTILKPEVLKQNESLYGAMDKRIENVIEKEPVANLDINGDRLEVSRTMLQHDEEEEHPRSRTRVSKGKKPHECPENLREEEDDADKKVQREK